MKLRFLAVAVAVVTSVVLVAPVSAAGTPPRTTDRADAAAGWLARQLVDGDHFEAVFGGQTFPDQGLTIDAILAFASAGVANTSGGKAITWLARPDILPGYIGDGVTDSFAGSTAKAALAAQVRGLNPASFGGVDLISRLRALLTPSGRFSDRSQFGDFTNTFSQALAIIALRRTPGGVPASAVDFAVGTQCPDGGFPLNFGVTPCASDTDATAMVTQALLATGRFRDAQEGLAWLASRQQAGGGISFGPGDPAVAPNANSTGLAGQAFRAGGRLAPAVRAQRFLISLQVDCAGSVANRGTIAFDATGFDPDTVVRATAQGILGLGGPSLARLTAAGSAAGNPILACH